MWQPENWLVQYFYQIFVHKFSVTSQTSEKKSIAAAAGAIGRDRWILFWFVLILSSLAQPGPALLCFPRFGSVLAPALVDFA